MHDAQLSGQPHVQVSLAEFKVYPGKHCEQRLGSEVLATLHPGIGLITHVPLAAAFSKYKGNAQVAQLLGP